MNSNFHFWWDGETNILYSNTYSIFRTFEKPELKNFIFAERNAAVTLDMEKWDFEKYCTGNILDLLHNNLDLWDFASRKVYRNLGTKWNFEIEHWNYDSSMPIFSKKSVIFEKLIKKWAQKWSFSSEFWIYHIENSIFTMKIANFENKILHEQSKTTIFARKKI